MMPCFYNYAQLELSFFVLNYKIQRLHKLRYQVFFSPVSFLRYIIRPSHIVGEYLEQEIIELSSTRIEWIIC